MAKVLLIAPGANRDDVGEAWVAYQWARRLGALHEVTLLTYRKRDRGSVLGQLTGVRVVEWVEPPLIGNAERFNSLVKPWYPLFYAFARRWAKQALLRGEHFDVAHQPVPVAMRYPSPVAGLGIPYVLGPVGGSMATPSAFRTLDTAPWYVELRQLDAWRLRRDPLLRRTYADAAMVLGIAPYVRESLSRVPVRRFQVMSETAIVELPPEVDRSRDPDVLRLLFVGRLIRTKGARDAIAALAHLRDLPISLDIVGDGFDRSACEQLVNDLGLADRVRFHGQLPRPLIDRFYGESDVFVFPSYREPGGNVPFEAMSYGLPLIVSDRGGPGHVVSAECGFRITPGTPAQFASDIAAAIRSLVEQPGLRRQMAAASRARAGEVGTWERRMAEIEAVYATCVDVKPAAGITGNSPPDP